MTKKVFYAVAVLALISGIAYGLVMDPRPCGMDDVSSLCGSGARRGAVVTGVLVALLLGYIGRTFDTRRH